MSTSTPTPDTTPQVAPLQRLGAFLHCGAGRPALLGCGGAVFITVGGLGAGSIRVHDPLLESLHLSWLRFGHGLVLSSVVLWLGVLTLLTAWIWLGRRVLQRSADEYTMRVCTACWLAPLLLSVPVFSRDTYSYLAQGALLRDGFDPYAVGPVENPNGLLDDVSPIWTTTTAPYGPAFILVAKLVTMAVGDNAVVGTMVLRLCMLPGLALLVWAVPRIARSIGADGATALWICALNPLVIIHLMGGVHNEMLMVGLLAAGIALTLRHRPVVGFAVVTAGVAVKATAGIALPFLVWVWANQLRDRRDIRPLAAFARATAGCVATFVAVFALFSLLAGVGLGWLTAIAGSAVKIINWLTLPTATANLVNVVGGLFGGVNFYAVLEVARIVGIGVIVVALPLLWLRFRHDDREALTGIALAMAVVVLFVPAALPWYYTWPLAVLSALAQSPTAIAVIAAFSTWIMVIFKPDGSHGMYSWLHVALATAAAALAWYGLRRRTTPAPEPVD
ncbi:alpha-(1-_6)-mannopyranosyltransferase A [Mycobacterium sp. MYCO198283]|uniref:alpha-(1->6)-mannopyranosyltransferase A n=1 Tax=Mycobacterium sp. MYCO198283 TaxID=2883505 RepID=UPI001E45A5C1|nr:alpha-(1->6)-mannopyranosyltransferase A [Mycobacterium sp. MYCO198283]MCG5432717.1 alpha-(1->6)-mannopyranosyltransferase A [Mycobacterium sp. MYCO198283]